MFIVTYTLPTRERCLVSGSGLGFVMSIEAKPYSKFWPLHTTSKHPDTGLGSSDATLAKSMRHTLRVGRRAIP